MTHREKFIKALKREPITGRVPTFELVFFLTMEAFGKVHPSHRSYHQWNQMKEAERKLHREDMADLYIHTAEKYEHSAIFYHPSPNTREEHVKTVQTLREKSGDKYFLMQHGDATFGLPDGDRMLEFSYRLADEPEKVKAEADMRVNSALERAAEVAKIKDGKPDGYALCSDYCLNSGPFLSPEQFSEFVAPYLKKLIKGFRDLGYYTIKHTDGNIMPIIDQLMDAKPDALHSIDPQAGVDIAKVKKMYGNQVCLIGNVNCGLMDSGTDEQVKESARYALKHGMPGGGYIFSTSNCVYTGMELRRYEMILDIWRKEGNYV